MFNLKKSLIAFIAVLALYGVEVRANSFTITNVEGVAFVNTSRDGGPPILRPSVEFHLGGPGLSITAFHPEAWLRATDNVEAWETCRIISCAPGEETVLGSNSTFSGILAAQGATAVVNGVRFENVRLTGSVNFVSQPIVLNFGVDHRVTIPFTFSGEINGVSPFTLTPIFTATLNGQGLATFYFERSWNPLSQRYFLYSIEYRFGPLPISIDIKPATFPNSINPNSKGKIPVAILTTDSFDATTVDPTTVLFGPTGSEIAPVHSALEDVDGDGDIDMVLHFVTQHTAITCGNDSASLTGATFSGVKIKGTDSIETVACN